MSKDPIDQWLDDVEFEIYRLSFRPSPFHLKVLEAYIQHMESMPVNEEISVNLEATILRLNCLKQDLISLQRLNGYFEHVEKMRQQALEQGLGQWRPYDFEEVCHDFVSRLQVTKHEQRSRQYVHLANLRRFWPEADQARRKRTLGLLKPYIRQRFQWGVFNLQMSTTLKIARWTGRMLKRLRK